MNDMYVPIGREPRTTPDKQAQIELQLELHSLKRRVFVFEFKEY